MGCGFPHAIFTKYEHTLSDTCYLRLHFHPSCKCVRTYILGDLQPDTVKGQLTHGALIYYISHLLLLRKSTVKYVRNITNVLFSFLLKS